MSYWVLPVSGLGVFVVGIGELDIDIMCNPGSPYICSVLGLLAEASTVVWRVQACSS